MVKIMNVAISLGGSVFTEKLDDVEFFASQVRRIAEKNGKVVVVIGAGRLKHQIEACSENTTNSERDMVGIRATRLNADVLRTYLPNAYPGIPESVEELRKAVSMFDIVVMGGTEPGHSTDGVAALAAEVIGAEVMINATDVKGVYRDKEDPGTKVDELDYTELRSLLESHSSEPGKYSLMDNTSVDILERSGIKTVVLNGLKENEIAFGVEGTHSGTGVKPSDR